MNLIDIRINMKLENIKKHEDLPEDIKDKYKSINEKGDFVEKGAIDNSETAHRRAVLENEAFGELVESVGASGLSVDEIVLQLDKKGLPYDEKNKLEDLLFQNADLQRLKGRPVDEHISEALKKLYTSTQYSEILSAKIVEGVESGDIEVIGEVLKDEKFKEGDSMLEKLENDEQRKQVFEICKQRISSACAIVLSVDDLDLAIDMYTEVLRISDKESYSDKSEIESTGRYIASKLFKADEKEKLLSLVGSGTLRLVYFKDFIHRLGTDQQYLIELLNNSSDVDDIYGFLRFVTDSTLLEKLYSDESSLSKFDDNNRKKAIEYIKIIVEALKNAPDIRILSELKNDEKAQYRDGKEAKNKFVVGVRGGKYVVAISNMDTYEYHKDIFQAIGGAKSQSGGYLGIDKVEEKTLVRMVRSSGDFGFYSRELLEKYRDSIEEALKVSLGDQKFELVIKTSSDFE